VGIAPAVVARIGEEHVEIGSAKWRGDGQYLLGVAAPPVQHDDGSGGVRGREQPAERVTAAHREDAHRLEGESIAGQRTGLAHAAGGKTQMHARRDQRRREREERAKGE